MPFVQRDETLPLQAGISHDAILNCEEIAGQILEVPPKISHVTREAQVTG